MFVNQNIVPIGFYRKADLMDDYFLWVFFYICNVDIITTRALMVRLGTLYITTANHTTRTNFSTKLNIHFNTHTNPVDVLYLPTPGMAGFSSLAASDVEKKATMVGRCCWHCSVTPCSLATCCDDGIGRRDVKSSLDKVRLVKNKEEEDAMFL